MGDTMALSTSFIQHVTWNCSFVSKAFHSVMSFKNASTLSWEKLSILHCQCFILLCLLGSIFCQDSLPFNSPHWNWDPVMCTWMHHRSAVGISSDSTLWVALPHHIKLTFQHFSVVMWSIHSHGETETKHQSSFTWKQAKNDLLWNTPMCSLRAFDKFWQIILGKLYCLIS